MKSETRRNLLSLGFLSATISTNIYVSVPNLDLISSEFMVNDFVVSIIAGSFFFFYGLSAVFWGFVIDRFNLSRKRGLYYALIAAIIFDLIAGIANNPYILLLCNVLIGIFLGFSIPAIYGVIVDYFPIEKRLFAIAVWNLLSSIGSSAGFAFSFASGIFGSWRYAFYIVAFVQVVSLIVLKIIREPLKGRSEDILKEVFEKGLTYDYILDEKEFIKTVLKKTNYFLVAQSFFISASWGAYMGWGIHFMIREAGLDKVQAVAILGLVGLGGSMSVLLAKIVERFQKIDLKIKLVLAGFFVGAEGTAYIIMYSLIRILSPNISAGDIITSVILLLNTLAQNSLFLLAIMIGAIGNCMGSTAGPIRGSVISEVNFPEEKSALIGVMVVSDHIGRSAGIVLVGIISTITNSLYLGLISSFTLYYIGAISWLFASKSYLRDREYLVKTLKSRRDLIIKRVKEGTLKRDTTHS